MKNRAYIAARDAREAVLRDGGAARQGALRARERADAAVAAAQNARKTAGREADEKAAREAGYEEANAAYEKYLWSGSGPKSTPEETRRPRSAARIARLTLALRSRSRDPSGSTRTRNQPSMPAWTTAPVWLSASRPTDTD